ncbi:MAG: hypothetical protein HFJ06_03130 [Lachnospiraceae bacterium]|nr:hypothetical protein [Lachnospiraceae bacterium]
MNIDLSRFKVIYNNRIYNAMALVNMRFDAIREEEEEKLNPIYKPSRIEIIVLNEDGNIIIINDETWKFQFLPIVGNN